MWGLIILIFGGLLLAANFGYISENFWQQIWKFWPVILIIWGIQALSFKGEKKGKSRGFIISIVIVLLVIAGVIWQTEKSSSHVINHTIVAEADPKKEVDLSIKFGASELNVDGNGSGALVGSIDSFGSADLQRDDSGDKTSIIVNQVTNNVGLWIGKDRKNVMNLSLSEIPVYSVHLDTGASKFNLDFSKVKLRELIVNGGACSGEIKIGEQVENIKLNISSGASSYDIKIPKNSAIKINDDSGLSSLNYDGITLTKNGKEYKSGDYDAATKKVGIQLSTGVSSVNISQY